MIRLCSTARAGGVATPMFQVALMPVFLLSGIATLLNVFSTRLARVADRVEAVSKEREGADEENGKSCRPS